jgi:multidrug efflux pump subunit AcrA (membrane-fusion protein)
MIKLVRKNSVCLLVIFLFSCRGETKSNDSDVHTQAGTPVTVTTVKHTKMEETIELNATSSFLLKTPVKSITGGYLQNVKIRQGDFVNRGDVMMNLVTKEARALGGAVNNLDTSFHFKGQIDIVAPCSGYIVQLNFQNGDYVQDGEQIAVISDAKSFVFILELPYELNPLLKLNKKVEIILPDSSHLTGTIENSMPAVETASQTQRYLISVNKDRMIPENLIAKVVLIKSSKENAIALPDQAVLTDETQNTFWVMKLLNDSVAVKVIIRTGIEDNGMVEILAPHFNPTDRIIVSGNYGLPDTAKVTLLNDAQ